MCSFMDFNAEPCMMEQIEAAKQRKNDLDTYYLLRDCAWDPQKADSYETLKGMAQESPIIHLKFRPSVPKVYAHQP